MGLNHIDPSRETIEDLSEPTFLGIMKDGVILAGICYGLCFAMDKCSKPYNPTIRENENTQFYDARETPFTDAEKYGM